MEVELSKKSPTYMGEENYRVVKKSRQRKKHIYFAIRKQIEFYFSDVNLSKDRFFASLMKDDPYIDMEYILNCNLVRKLTTNPSDIVKALRQSNLISTTDDGTKVFRTKPLKPVENEDDCTIYVEDLPLDVDHEWLRSVFKVFGNIVYVSLPRYQHSNKCKGFAFVQFETPEGANNALKAFERVDSCLSSSMPATSLQSIITFEGDKDTVVARSPISEQDIKYVPLSSDKNEEENVNYTNNRENGICVITKANIEADTENRANNRDTQECITENNDVDEIGVKLVCDDQNTTSEIKTSGAIEEDKAITSTDYDNNDLTDGGKRKHRRRHKKKKQKCGGLVLTYGMHILSKRDWKRLRNKYLEEQKKRSRELKKQLWLAKCKHSAQESEPKSDSDVKQEAEIAVELQKSDTRVKFTPGVIVKITLRDPLKNVNSFKNDARSADNVEYVDATTNSTEAFIRCSSSDAADELAMSGKWPIANVLRGEEEQAYWEKVFKDRDEKISKKIRVKVRGQDKLKKKIDRLALMN